ncbi:unnamed protein product [Parascedosporium putredinis]|uniref:Uncharacterized protein n=1 Tax=Parascedosporium putredinis TaxID=1442378 RepID=A0A9P1HAB1_9PEZI|nr:unnamed protein product [Parascedosporium putredinis]CAI8001926.1 unnamed protein product [Parascedosporium putredinis]
METCPIPPASIAVALLKPLSKNHSSLRLPLICVALSSSPIANVESKTIHSRHTVILSSFFLRLPLLSSASNIASRGPSLKT